MTKSRKITFTITASIPKWIADALANPKRAKPGSAAWIDWHCADCERSIQNERYVVRNTVWKKAGDVSGRLCVGCIEKRLGRKLTPKDFPRTPLNDGTGSRRLLNRQGYSA